jgi:hypothetical protein
MDLSALVDSAYEQFDASGDMREYASIICPPNVEKQEAPLLNII